MAGVDYGIRDVDSVGVSHDAKRDMGRFSPDRNGRIEQASYDSSGRMHAALRYIPWCMYRPAPGNLWDVFGTVKLAA